MKYLMPLTLFATATVLHADEEMRLRNIENRISSLECSQNCCWTINPPARPYNPDCFGFYVSIDPLIWQAHVNGTEVAILTKNSPDFFAPNGLSRVKPLQFDWDFGFRLALGLNLPHDAWDSVLRWTRWTTEAKRDIHADEDSAIYPRFGHPATLDSINCDALSSCWKMDYNILDLEGAREYWVSKCVSLRPFGGLRAAWINQKDFDIDLKEVNSIAFSHYQIDSKDRYFGIGVRSGINMLWGLGSGFSIFNEFAGNLLYAYHSVKHKEQSAEEAPFFIENFFHVGSAIFDMQLGLQYDWFSCDCCYHLGIDFGWEHHYHPGQNQFMLFVSDIMPGKFVANQGDLGIQGYFARVRFDF